MRYGSGDQKPSNNITSNTTLSDGYEFIDFSPPPMWPAYSMINVVRTKQKKWKWTCIANTLAALVILLSQSPATISQWHVLKNGDIYSALPRQLIADGLSQCDFMQISLLIQCISPSCVKSRSGLSFDRTVNHIVVAGRLAGELAGWETQQRCMDKISRVYLPTMEVFNLCHSWYPAISYQIVHKWCIESAIIIKFIYKRILVYIDIASHTHAVYISRGKNNCIRKQALLHDYYSYCYYCYWSRRYCQLVLLDLLIYKYKSTFNAVWSDRAPNGVRLY